MAPFYATGEKKVQYHLLQRTQESSSNSDSQAGSCVFLTFNSHSLTSISRPTFYRKKKIWGA